MPFTDHDSGSLLPADLAASTTPPPVFSGPTQRYEGTPLLEALVRLAPDATAVADASGRIRVINRQLEELFGYSADELLGQPVELLIPDGVRALHRQHRATYANAPRVRPMGAHLSLSGRRRDGSAFPLEASLGPLDAGDEQLVIVSIRDITERQRAHDTVSSANRDLRALQAVTDTALSHLALDDLLTALLERVTAVLQVDNAAVLLLDAAGETLTVRAVRGLEEPVAPRVHVPMGHGFAGHIAATREPLVVDDIATIPVANPFLREQLHSAAGVPLVAGEQLLGVVHIGTALPRRFTAHDVDLLQQVADRMALAIDRARLYGKEQHAREMAEAAQDQAEAALTLAQVSEHRYRCLVEANIIGIVVSDAEHIIEVNDAVLRMLDYSRADLVEGRLHVADLMTPASAAARAGSIRDVLATGASPPMEREMVHKDGSHVPALVGMALLERDPARFVSFVVDLSEQKHLELALAERVAQLEAIMEAVPEPLTVYDTGSHVVLANAAYKTLIARLLPRTSPGETLSQRVEQFGGVYGMDGTLLAVADLAQTCALRGEVLTGANAVETIVHSPEGEPIYFSATGAPLRDSMGRITGAVTMSRDITEYMWS
jgi:PAS domain S-box-containing protein